MTIQRYECDIVYDPIDGEQRYSAMEQYDMGDYVLYEDHVDALERATRAPATVDLVEFEARVKEDTEWWNSKQGTTCEMAIGYNDIQAKMEILAKYTELMDDGAWAVHHCSTCEGHHKGERNLHAMIWRTTYF